MSNERVDYQPGTHREHEARRGRVNRERPELSRPNAELVTRLANTLLALEEAANPARSTQISGQTRTAVVGSERDEGASTRWARALQRRIHKRMAEFFSEYDARVEGTYQPPPKPDLVRCIYSRCAAYGKRIPKYVGPGNQIELSRCPNCDKKLTAA